ncbi:MAG: ribonuclease HIII [Verrucomicrobiota bacterium]
MAITSYTEPLSAEQAETLRGVLEGQGFEFMEKPYTIFAAKKGKLNISVYEKGPKVLVQGKETEEFVKFTLEPEILGEAKLGYEEELNPEMFEPHFGIDESGKGDFFGPLVIAGVYTDGKITRQLMEAGIQDSKAIKSDKRIRDFAEIIRNTRGVAYDVVAINPARYNELYKKFANLNKLLAWGHAKVIENLIERRPDCPRALSDQFANPRELESAVKRKGSTISVEQRTKAESDIAVAAASILARENFIDWLRDNGKSLGIQLPRGASKEVQRLTKDLRDERGADFLNEVGKTHFKFANDLL